MQKVFKRPQSSSKHETMESFANDVMIDLSLHMEIGELLLSEYMRKGGAGIVNEMRIIMQLYPNR